MVTTINFVRAQAKLCAVSVDLDYTARRTRECTGLLVRLTANHRTPKTLDQFSGTPNINHSVENLVGKKINSG